MIRRLESEKKDARLISWNQEALHHSEVPKHISPDTGSFALSTDERSSLNPEEISNVGEVKRMIEQVSHLLKTNMDLRRTFSSDPSRFMGSEIDLNAGIRSLLAIALDHEYIRVLLTCGGLELICELLSHPNDDAVSSSLEVLVEVTKDEAIAHFPYLDEMLQSLNRSDIVSHLSDSLTVMRSVNGEGCGLCLRAISNILEIDDKLISVNDTSKLLSALQSIIDQHNPDDLFNRSYALEILIHILERISDEQLSSNITHQLLDSLLLALSRFRDKNPAEAIEKEFYCNLIHVLCILSEIPSIREEVISLEAIQLFVRLLMVTKDPAPLMRVIYVCIRENESASIIFIDHQGLRIIGSLISSRHRKVKELVVTVLNELLKTTKGTHKDRVIGKLVEKNCEKLSTMFSTIAELLPHVRDDGEYLDRCDKGLYTVQQTSLVVLRLFNEGNASLKERILSEFASKRVQYQDFIQIVLEFTQLLDPDNAINEINEIRDYLAIFQTSALAT